MNSISQMHTSLADGGWKHRLGRKWDHKFTFLTISTIPQSTEATLLGFRWNMISVLVACVLKTVGCIECSTITKVAGQSTICQKHRIHTPLLDYRISPNERINFIVLCALTLIRLMFLSAHLETVTFAPALKRRNTIVLRCVIRMVSWSVWRNFLYREWNLLLFFIAN